jgi:hypothetical protein
MSCFGEPESKHLLLTLRMEVNPTDGAFYLIKANVVKPFETCSRYSSNTVIWNQKIFFPPHEDIVSLCEIRISEIGPFRHLG